MLWVVKAKPLSRCRQDRWKVCFVLYSRLYGHKSGYVRACKGGILLPPKAMKLLTVHCSATWQTCQVVLISIRVLWFSQMWCLLGCDAVSLSVMSVVKAMPAILLNEANFLPNDTASHPRRLQFSKTRMGYIIKQNVKRDYGLQVPSY